MTHTVNRPSATVRSDAAHILLSLGLSAGDGIDSSNLSIPAVQYLVDLGWAELIPNDVTEGLSLITTMDGVIAAGQMRRRARYALSAIVRGEYVSGATPADDTDDHDPIQDADDSGPES